MIFEVKLNGKKIDENEWTVITEKLKNMYSAYRKFRKLNGLHRKPGERLNRSVRVYNG